MEEERQASSGADRRLFCDGDRRLSSQTHEGPEEAVLLLVVGPMLPQMCCCGRCCLPKKKTTPEAAVAWARRCWPVRTAQAARAGTTALRTASLQRETTRCPGVDRASAGSSKAGDPPGREEGNDAPGTPGTGVL